MSDVLAGMRQWAAASPGALTSPHLVKQLQEHVGHYATIAEQIVARGDESKARCGRAAALTRRD
eukprot:5102667-Pyramimonas_sp.AAC.1